MITPDRPASGDDSTQYGLRPLLNFLKQSRHHYLSQYRSFIENQRKAGRMGEPEVLLETDDDSLFDRLLVADYLISGDAPHVVRFEPSRQLEFEPVTVILNGMNVVIERLRWDDVLIESDAGVPAKDDMQVWFEEWTEPRENPDDHHEPLANVLHSVRFEDDRLRLDLGSVPPQALVDMFLLLHEAGAKNVKLI